jgi:hypothetical protein
MDEKKASRCQAFPTAHISFLPVEVYVPSSSFSQNGSHGLLQSGGSELSCDRVRGMSGLIGIENAKVSLHSMVL